MAADKPGFTVRDILFLVDVQVDFCPGGALPIEAGDEIVPVLNAWIRHATQEQIPVYASRDWHPLNHISFAPSGGPWPPHCVQDTEGAAFHPDLLLPDDVVVVTKGTRFDQDQNSAFDQTGLAFWLKRAGVNRLFIGGLALDVCVLATVLDALKEGFAVQLLVDGTRAVTSDGAKLALEKMQQAGASILQG